MVAENTRRQYIPEFKRESDELLLRPLAHCAEVLSRLYGYARIHCQRGFCR